MTIKAIFFDFDGTLAHTAVDMLKALHGWQTANGQPLVDYQKARLQVSGGARALLSLAGVTESDENYDAARDDFLSRYEEGGYPNTILFSGIKEALSLFTAQDISWGIVTNKPRRYFSAIMDMLEISAHSSPFLGPIAPPVATIAGDDCPSKPAPDSLILAAMQANVSPEQCLYVGDDIRDAQAAKAAGMRFIIAGWGYWTAQEWEKVAAVEAIATTPQCLKTLIFAMR